MHGKEPVRRVIAMVPAHNEEDSIGATIAALLDQTRVPDEIYVIADNCTDDTYEVARVFKAYSSRVRVVKTIGNTLKKPGAMNWAWNRFCQNADVLVTLDADTVLPPNAVADWCAEFEDDPKLGGSSSKFTMLGDDVLTRLQRYEFARWTYTGLKRGWTSVLAGTGCAIRNDVLKTVANRSDRDGPWFYDSKVEDFELTYRIREMGYYCHVSPTVRAYTDAMKTVKSLWNQRMKWQCGTVEDLLRFGINKYTRIDWAQQALGLFAAFVRFMWPALIIVALLTDNFQFIWWWLLPTVLFVINDTRMATLIPHCDRKDRLLAASFVPGEFFAYMRAAWFIAAWHSIFMERLTGNKKDRWAMQYSAEAEGGR
jgi:cellulose synthase/poly-beta-1,6-N-acetylglucosamine synthase-like glycosyltransferase